MLLPSPPWHRSGAFGCGGRHAWACGVRGVGGWVGAWSGWQRIERRQAREGMGKQRWPPHQNHTPVLLSPCGSPLPCQRRRGRRPGAPLQEAGGVHGNYNQTKPSPSTSPNHPSSSGQSTPTRHPRGLTLLRSRQLHLARVLSIDLCVHKGWVGGWAWCVAKANTRNLERLGEEGPSMREAHITRRSP